MSFITPNFSISSTQDLAKKPKFFSHSQYLSSVANYFLWLETLIPFPGFPAQGMPEVILGGPNSDFLPVFFQIELLNIFVKQ